MLALNRDNQQAIWQSNLLATPSTTVDGQTLTAHATPHSKGTWVSIFTTTYDVYGFWLLTAKTATSTVQTDMMLDIAIGPAQENIIVPEYLCGWISDIALSPRMTYFPIFIPRGTLISARIQALITLDTMTVQFYAVEGASALPGPFFVGCDAYGTNAAASQGTSHTPGNTGAESTAANIGGVTARTYGAVLFSQNGTLANTTMSVMAYHWELVIGGVTRCEWFMQTNSAEYVIGPYPPTPFFVTVPEGTQLQVQAEASGTAQAQDVACYCFY